MIHYAHKLTILPVAASALLVGVGCMMGPDRPGWFVPAATVLSTEGSSVAPDYGCLGAPVRPAGPDATLALGVTPFGAPPTVRIPGMQVQIFPNNVVEPEDQCNLDCIQRASDAEGIATFEVPRRARLAYRVLPQTGPDAAATFLRTVEYGFLWPDDPEMTEWFNTISLGVMDGLVVSAGNMRDRQRAVLSGRVLDCQDRPVSAAWVRVFDEEGQEIEGRAGAFGGPQILYFDGLVPPSLDVEAEYTAADGRWAAANIAEGAVRVEAWARLDPGADPVLVACEAFTTFPDSLIVGGLRPWRETMPAACGERPPSP